MITKAMLLYHAQGGRCFHCNGGMLITPAARPAPGRPFDNGWTRDHLIPVSKGGNARSKNIVLAHSKCNNRRGNADPTQAMFVKRNSIYAVVRREQQKREKRT